MCLGVLKVTEAEIPDPTNSLTHQGRTFTQRVVGFPLHAFHVYYFLFLLLIFLLLSLLVP